MEDELVGIGGIDVEPWAGAEHVGRLRRLYVVARCRRLGIGSLLVKHLLKEASGTFELVRPSVADDRERQFYESIGFTSVDDPHASHGVKPEHRG